MSAALATAMVAGPGAPLAAAQVSGNVTAQVAAESPANRAIEIREGGLPLQLGSEGALVVEVQRKLRISADGVFGPQTDAAVRSYQRDAGLQVDGIVGLATWAALFQTQPASGASIGGSNIPPQVRERVEHTVEQAGQELAAQGDTQLSAPGTSVGGNTGTSVGGNTGTSVGGNSGTETTTSTPAPVPGGQACGSSTISTPVRGTVTSPFGPRGGRNHDGMDIAAPTGTPVHAVACGTVSLAGQQSGYGNIVCVTHTSQFSTCYAHLSRFAVSNGARVQQGQVIGYVGCTGSCTGPHLHFETRVGGQAHDPTEYLRGASIPGRSASTSASASTSTSVTGTSQTGSTTSTGTTSGSAIGPTTETAAPGTPGEFTPADSTGTPIPPDPTVEGVVTAETAPTVDPAVDPAAAVTAETAPAVDPAATVTAETAPAVDPAATVTAEAAPAAPAVDPAATASVETAPAEVAPAPAADASVTSATGTTSGSDASVTGGVEAGSTEVDASVAATQ